MNVGPCKPKHQVLKRVTITQKRILTWGNFSWAVAGERKGVAGIILKVRRVKENSCYSTVSTYSWDPDVRMPQTNQLCCPYDRHYHRLPSSFRP